MRLIDADKIDFSEVFIGASDFAEDTRTAAQMLIDKQPTVDPIKSGRWMEIVTHNGCTPDCDCVCSACNGQGVPHYDYCPHCGARMDMENAET